MSIFWRVDGKNIRANLTCSNSLSMSDLRDFLNSNWELISWESGYTFTKLWRV